MGEKREEEGKGSKTEGDTQTMRFTPHVVVAVHTGKRGGIIAGKSGGIILHYASQC